MLRDNIPVISVIMPMYNSSAYVAEAIESVLAQTFRDFELIVIDDGSTDPSLEIAQNYARCDSRISIISQPNAGPSAARNRGLEHAIGRYIYFFDSDDLLELDAFSVCVGCLSRYNLDFICFSGKAFSEFPGAEGNFRFYQKPNILEPMPGERLMSILVLLDKYSPSPCLYMFSREIIQGTADRFDEGFLREDEGFTPLLYCLSKRAMSLEKSLFMRRVRESSIMTSRISLDHIEGLVQAVVKIDTFLDNRAVSLEAQTRSALRVRQRRMLRSASQKAEELSCISYFVRLVRSRFGIKRLFIIDAVFCGYILFKLVF